MMNKTLLILLLSLLPPSLAAISLTNLSAAIRILRSDITIDRETIQVTYLLENESSIGLYETLHVAPPIAQFGALKINDQPTSYQHHDVALSPTHISLNAFLKRLSLPLDPGQANEVIAHSNTHSSLLNSLLQAGLIHADGNKVNWHIHRQWYWQQYFPPREKIRLHYKYPIFFKTQTARLAIEVAQRGSLLSPLQQPRSQKANTYNFTIEGTELHRFCFTSSDRAQLLSIVNPALQTPKHQAEFLAEQKYQTIVGRFKAHILSYPLLQHRSWFHAIESLSLHIKAHPWQGPFLCWPHTISSEHKTEDFIGHVNNLYPQENLDILFLEVLPDDD